MIYNNQNFYLMNKNIRENFSDLSKYKTKKSSDLSHVQHLKDA